MRETVVARHWPTIAAIVGATVSVIFYWKNLFAKFDLQFWPLEFCLVVGCARDAFQDRIHAQPSCVDGKLCDRAFSSLPGIAGWPSAGHWLKRERRVRCNDLLSCRSSSWALSWCQPFLCIPRERVGNPNSSASRPPATFLFLSRISARRVTTRPGRVLFGRTSRPGEWST